MEFVKNYLRGISFHSIVLLFLITASKGLGGVHSDYSSILVLQTVLIFVLFLIANEPAERLRRQRIVPREEWRMRKILDRALKKCNCKV